MLGFFVSSSKFKALVFLISNELDVKFITAGYEAKNKENTDNIAEKFFLTGNLRRMSIRASAVAINSIPKLLGNPGRNRAIKIKETIKAALCIFVNKDIKWQIINDMSGIKKHNSEASFIEKTE